MTPHPLRPPSCVIPTKLFLSAGNFAVCRFPVSSLRRRRVFNYNKRIVCERGRGVWGRLDLTLPLYEGVGGLAGAVVYVSPPIHHLQHNGSWLLTLSCLLRVCRENLLGIGCYWNQGLKLGGVWSPGLPWILLWPPQISGGSPLRCTGFYTEHLKVASEDAIGLTGKKNNFKPWKSTSEYRIDFQSVNL